MTKLLLSVEERLQRARLAVQAAMRVAELPSRSFDGATVEAAGRVIATICGEAEADLTAAIREIDAAMSGPAGTVVSIKSERARQ